VRRRTTHRDEISGGGQLFITIAMPLDLAFGFAMVVIFLRIGFLMTTIPTQRIYEGYWLSGDSRVFFVRHFGTFCNVGCRYEPVKNYESIKTMRAQFALTYCSYVHFI